jgi:hypothetical protein
MGVDETGEEVGCLLGEDEGTAIALGSGSVEEAGHVLCGIDGDKVLEMEDKEVLGENIGGYLS